MVLWLIIKAFEVLLQFIFEKDVEKAPGIAVWNDENTIDAYLFYSEINNKNC